MCSVVVHSFSRYQSVHTTVPPAGLHCKESFCFLKYCCLNASRSQPFNFIAKELVENASTEKAAIMEEPVNEMSAIGRV